jgi:hypothetical protein
MLDITQRLDQSPDDLDLQCAVRPASGTLPRHRSSNDRSPKGSSDIEAQEEDFSSFFPATSAVCGCSCAAQADWLQQRRYVSVEVPPRRGSNTMLTVPRSMANQPMISATARPITLDELLADDSLWSSRMWVCDLAAAFAVPTSHPRPQPEPATLDAVDSSTTEV